MNELEQLRYLLHQLVLAVESVPYPVITVASLQQRSDTVQEGQTA